jgi:hypothetical protein
MHSEFRSSERCAEDPLHPERNDLRQRFQKSSNRLSKAAKLLDSTHSPDKDLRQKEASDLTNRGCGGHQNGNRGAEIGTNSRRALVAHEGGYHEAPNLPWTRKL